MAPIAVDGVPATTRKPGSYLDINTRGAKTGLPVVPDKILIIGHKLAAGDATPLEPVQVYSEGDARDAAGAGTPVALMVKALLEQNPYLSEIHLCLQNEQGGAAAAAGSMQWTVSSLTNGTLYVKIGRHVVRVAVTSTDTDANIATNVAAALTDAGWLPFQAGVSTNTTTLTAKCKGTAGNDWVLAYEFTGSGLSCNITQPNSGATDADITAALDAVFNEQFDLIAVEYNDATSLDALHTHLESVFGPMEQRPGLGFAGVVDTLGNATTLATGRNSEFIVLPYFRGTRTHPCELAAAMAALVASEEDRARPLNGLELKVAVPPDTSSDRLSRTEQESALNNGLAPIEVVGSECQIVRSITSYVTNSDGDADDTLLDLQTLRVLFYFRYALGIEFRDKFGRVKLAAVAKTPNTTDPDKIASVAIALALRLENQLGYLQGVEDDKDRFVFELDGSVAGRVNGRVPARIVPGLHVLAASIDLIL